MDLRDSTVDGIIVNIPDLRGTVVTSAQALVLSSLLGITVQDD